LAQDKAILVSVNGSNFGKLLLADGGKGHGRETEQVFLQRLYKRRLGKHPRTRERTSAIKNETNKDK
jgi:hypothetical protein